MLNDFLKIGRVEDNERLDRTWPQEIKKGEDSYDRRYSEH